MDNNNSKKSKKTSEVLLKWSEVLNTESDLLIEHLLETVRREDPGLLSAQGTTFYHDFENPGSYKSFTSLLSKGQDLMDSLNDNTTNDYNNIINLAKLVDDMGCNNQHLILLQNDHIYTNGQKILFDPLVLPKIVISDETRIDDEIGKKYAYKLPVKEINIGYDLIDQNLERYAFAIYLLETLFPRLPIRNLSIRHALDYAPIWHQEITPEYVEFMSEILIYSRSNINYSCVDIFKATANRLFDSFMTFKPYEECEINYDYGSRRGRKKRSSSHSEDEYEIIKTENYSDRFLIMVADGVSTADLGRGEFVSDNIRKTLLSKAKDVKEMLDNLPVDNYELFLSSSKQYLTDLIKLINEKAVEELNYLLLEEKKQPSDISNPMSSTVVIGIVCGNWCNFAHLGDSEIIVRRNDKSYIINLPHNVERCNIVSALKKGESLSESQLDNESLTSVIPLAEIKNDRFVPIEDPSTEIDYVNFFTEKGNYFITATDGLLSCFGKGSSLRAKGLKELDQFITSCSSLPIKELTKKILDYADDYSIDDVAIVLCINNGKFEIKHETKDKAVKVNNDKNEKKTKAKRREL